MASTCIVARNSNDIHIRVRIYSIDVRDSYAFYGVNLRATSGWLIFISLVVTTFHMVAIVDLFTDIKLLRIKIPLGKSLWYLFTIIVSI